ncbi:MAG: hypothetical protein HYV45_02975 [Candidatus Moranbacteria bacterium]|nr:hypothetical protein [Candidatus Moranbacteria bacterium]
MNKRPLQAYAAIMAARKAETSDQCDPFTIRGGTEEKDFRNQILESSLTPVQLIIAENVSQARENTDHLMSHALPDGGGYRNQIFSLSDISKKIDLYLRTLNDPSGKRKLFYLIGGWIFFQRSGNLLSEKRLLVQSSVGYCPEEAVADFLTRFHHLIGMKHVFQNGYILQYQEVSVERLMTDYISLVPFAVCH